MELKEFQLNAVKSLFEAMDKPVRDIILKSPTGSGKTIILTYFMHQYIQSYPKTVFVWLTPGKGNLEEQSKAKMDKYIHASQTKLLSDVMTAGFEENDSCFINWGSHHADDAGVNDCALNRHPDIGGANADHAKNQGKPKPAAECLLFLQQEGPHRWQIGQHGSDQNEKPYIEKQVKKHAVHHYPFSSGNSGPSLAFSVAPACSLGVPSQFLPILQ